MTYLEHEGFSRIGRHHLQERSAIIQYDMMVLVRAAARHAVGSAEDWDERLLYCVRYARNGSIATTRHELADFSRLY